MPYGHAELDGRIILAIEEFEGVPNANALGGAIGVAKTTLRRRIEANPTINEKMEGRGKEWLEALGEKEFLKKYSEMGWYSQLPGYAKKKIEERFDSIILREIGKFEGVPSAKALGRAIGVSSHTLKSRIEANPKINEKMETRGREWLDGLGEKEFLKKYSEIGWYSQLPGYAKKKIEERFDSIILKEIGKFEGVPSAEALGKPISVSSHTLRSRIEANTTINEKMEERGKEWLEALGEKEFLKKYSTKGWCSNLPEYARKKVEERFDSIILKEIGKFNGVPNAEALGKPISVASSTLRSRIEANPKINEKMEERGRKWLEALGEKEFLKKYSTGGWFSGLPEYARKKVEERFDSIILREIGKFEGVPSARALGRAIGVGSDALRRKIEANEKLWMAYYLKRGLTPDQAIELALERNEESDGFRKALNERIKHLSAFREMIGVLRCFGDLMEKIVSCISLYPEPLAKAAEEIGVKVKSTHVPMLPFRKMDAPEIPGCGTLVVQGLHRLPEEGLNLLFGKIRELYAEHPELSIITTHSMDYSASEGFFSGLERNGFRVNESGVVRLDPPDRKILEEYGVPFEELGRVERKVSGEFNVLVLGMEEKNWVGGISCLENAPRENGEPTVLLDSEGVDVPAGMGKDLKAKLFPSAAVVPSAPFLVEVMDGKKKCALIGFDMDPRRRNSIEVEVEPKSPSMDYRKIARKLAMDLRHRRGMGIRPNEISQVEITKLRRGRSAA